MGIVQSAVMSSGYLQIINLIAGGVSHGDLDRKPAFLG